MRRSTILCIALVAALAVGSSAYARAVNSSLTIKGTSNASPRHSKFYGKLTSTSHSCEQGQTVSLHYNDHENGFQVIGKDKTASNGKWSIKTGRGPIPPGKYYASTKKKGSCPAVKTSKVTATKVKVTD